METEKIMEEIRKFGEDIVYIKAMLQSNMQNIDLKFEKIEERLKVASNRIDEIENENRFYKRCFWTSLVGSVVAFILNGKLMV